MNNRSKENKIRLLLEREFRKSFIHPTDIVVDRQGSDIEKHHNDEKVMREVKSILEERSQESQSPKGNLRKGGTDRREHMLNLSNKIEKERGKKNDSNIRMKMDVDQ